MYENPEQATLNMWVEVFIAISLSETYICRLNIFIVHTSAYNMFISNGWNTSS